MVNQSNQSSNLCVLILLTMAVAFMLWQCFQKSNSITGGENNNNVNNANVNNSDGLATLNLMKDFVNPHHL